MLGEKFNIDGIDHFLSYAKKKVEDFKWAKEAYKVYYRSMSPSFEEWQRSYLKQNLAAGEMPNLNDMDLKRMGIKMYGHAAKRDFNLVPHFPLIDTLYEKMKGIRQRMNFEPMAVDISLFAKNIKSQEQLQRLQESLKYDYDLFKEKITREYLMRYGVTDVSQFSHEEQQDMQEEIGNRVKEMTPERINEYFDKEYYSPFSEQSQMMLDYESNTKNLKNHFEMRFAEGYKDNLEVSYMYTSHGLPRITLIDSRTFTNIESDDCKEIEYSERCFHQTYRAPMDILNLYGEDIKLSDIEKIKPGFFHIGFNGNINILNGVQETLALSHYADNYERDPERYHNIDQRTPEGQEKMMAFKSMFFNRNRTGSMISDGHVTFKTPIDMKSVKRITNGRIEYSWRDSDYEKNPDVDIDVKTFKSVKVWQARCIGDPMGEVFVKAGPLDFDWADISDPTKKRHPYSGGYHGTLVVEQNGTRRRRGLFDKGIVHQVNINIENARCEEEKGFNIGKVFVMLQEARGPDVTPEMFFDTMKGSRLIDLDGSQLTGTFASALAASGRIFNSVDMSNNVAVKDSMEQIEAHFRSMKRAMGVDEMDVNPYSTDNVARVGQENATNSTLDLFTTHIKYMNNTLQMYIDLCHYAYKKNPRVLEGVMNDMSYQLLLTEDFLQHGKPGVFIRNDIQDQMLLRETKMDAVHFIQNGAYSIIPDYVRFKMGRNMAEILNAAEAMARKSDNQQQQMMQAQQEQAKQAMAQRQQELEATWAHESSEKDKDRHTKIDTSAMMAEQWLNQADVDQDGQNDLNQNADKQRGFDREENEKDRRLKREIEMRKAELLKKKASVAQKR